LETKGRAGQRENFAMQRDENPVHMKISRNKSADQNIKYELVY
jgi:hypothetical protein